MSQLPKVEEVVQTPAKTIHLPKVMSDDEVHKLEGTVIKKQPKHILNENVDVFCEDTGRPILKMRKKAIPPSVWKQAFTSLEKAATPSDNRGMASGPISDQEIMEVVKANGGVSYRRMSPHRYVVVFEDGTESKVTRAKMSYGGIVGFFGRTARQPYCRLTSFAQDNFTKFKRSWPMLRWVDRYYEALFLEQYAKQVEAVNKSSEDFVIPNTAFSTVTVNKNFATACHYDKGDFAEGFGNLSVVRKGKYEGGYTCFPQYDAGVNAETGDIVLMDVHQLHGNSPMVREPNAVRLAFVMYFRDNIQSCKSEKEEISRARNRGDI